MGDPQHLHSFFQAAGTIVDTRQDMSMDINDSCSCVFGFHDSRSDGIQCNNSCVADSETLDLPAYSTEGSPAMTPDQAYSGLCAILCPPNRH